MYGFLFKPSVIHKCIFAAEPQEWTALKERDAEAEPLNA